MGELYAARHAARTPATQHRPATRLAPPTPYQVVSVTSTLLPEYGTVI